MSKLQQLTFKPTGGLNYSAAWDELAANESLDMVDALLDKPGLVRRRGPINNSTIGGGSQATLSFPAYGIVIAKNASDQSILAVMNGDFTGTNNISFYNSTFTSKIDYTTLPVGPSLVWNPTPALKGGAWLGALSSYALFAFQSLRYWKGANKAEYTTGTITASRGSTVVTGSGTTWTGNIVAGMFLTATSTLSGQITLIGTVKTVSTNTSIILEEASLWDVAGGSSYTLSSWRDMFARVTKGRITCSTASPTITGGNTKFKSQSLGPNISIFRMSDMAYVGTVSVVNNENSITLGGNAAVDCNNEKYVAALPLPGNFTSVGPLTCVYANRQWYANSPLTGIRQSRIWFSEQDDPEYLDTSLTGDFLDVTSTSSSSNSRIRAIVGLKDVLLVFKEDETFGIFGQSPNSFSVKKIHDDGAISPGALQQYLGGVVWAGKQGIYIYADGTITTLSQNLGNSYKAAISGLDLTTIRANSVLYRDHYIVHIAGYKTFCVNLTTGTITSWQNFTLRSAANFDEGSPKSWYIVNDATKGILNDTASLFDSTGVDVVSCEGGSNKQAFSVTTKAFDLSDPLTLKYIKELMLEYRADADLNLDIKMDLNPTATNTKTLTSTAGLAYLTPKRIRLDKRGRFIAFTVYQSGATTNFVELGPVLFEYRGMRHGRL